MQLNLENLYPWRKYIQLKLIARLCRLEEAGVDDMLEETGPYHDYYTEEQLAPVVGAVEDVLEARQRVKALCDLLG